MATRRRRRKPLKGFYRIKLPKVLELPKSIMAELERASNRHELNEGTTIVALGVAKLFELKARREARRRNADE
jgi:hypothetical protein